MKVVLTTNGHEAAEHAIRQAMAVLPLLDAQVWVVSVLDPEERIGANQNASEHLVRAAALLGTGGITAQTVQRRGHFAVEIVAVAHEVGADVVVVGSAAHGAFVEWVTQGVSSEVIKRWRGSVLVVGPA